MSWLFHARPEPKRCGPGWRAGRPMPPLPRHGDPRAHGRPARRRRGGGQAGRAHHHPRAGAAAAGRPGRRPDPGAARGRARPGADPGPVPAAAAVLGGLHTDLRQLRGNPADRPAGRRAGAGDHGRGGGAGPHGAGDAVGGGGGAGGDRVPARPGGRDRGRGRLGLPGGWWPSWRARGCSTTPPPWCCTGWRWPRPCPAPSRWRRRGRAGRLGRRGTAVGLAVGWVGIRIRAQVRADEGHVKLLLPYVAWLAAERIHVSGCWPCSPAGC